MFWAPPLQACLFERLRLGVPGVASELLAQRQRLLLEQGNMAQLVRSYNRILQALSKEERRLFKDRIRCEPDQIYVAQWLTFSKPHEMFSVYLRTWLAGGTTSTNEICNMCAGTWTGVCCLGSTSCTGARRSTRYGLTVIGICGKNAGLHAARAGIK